jgi:xanthine dehydrogenase accessory factor
VVSASAPIDQTASTTYAGLRGLLDELDRLHAAGSPALLGIVVATTGSTYQKPGALVLLDRGGMRHGVISGGCLEPELEQRADAVFAAGRAALIDLDTRSDDDLLFGSGSGCRGRVRLLLLPQPPDAPLTQALHACVSDAVALDLDIELGGANAGNGSAVAHVDAAASPRRWQWSADGSADPATRADDTHPPTASLRILAPPRILLLGAGPETPALLAFSRRFGWSTTIVEHRGRWSAFARGGDADRHFDLAPGAAFERLATTAFDAAIAMSHNYALDAQFLRWCAGRDVEYVGLLGPPARRDALLAELGADAERLRPRLRAPVGLDLGSSGPEAIAVAIVAELQRHFARRQA